MTLSRFITRSMLSFFIGMIATVCASLGVRLGFRFSGAMLVGDIPISFIQGREDAEKTMGTVSQCYLSHRDAG